MKKGIIPKTLRKRAGRRKQEQTARTLERKIRTSLTRSARKLADELQSVEEQLTALPDRLSCHWVWLADIRRAGHMMEQVLEVLEDAKATSSPESLSLTGPGSAVPDGPPPLLKDDATHHEVAA